MRIMLCLIVAAFFVPEGAAQERHKNFEIKDGQFLAEGKPVQIHSGEMHYARIPKAYWRHRMKMVKAMGLNTIATNVFWNYHTNEIVT